MKQDIEIIRGTSNTLNIAVTDANGEPLTLSDGEVIIFGVKKRTEHEKCLIKKIITKVTDGVCSVEISPADTESMDFGKYSYDVGLKSGNDYFNIIPCSEFRVCDNVTGRGDSA